MKTFLVSVLFFTALATYVNGQGAPDVGGDVDAISEANMPDGDVSVDAQGGIDIEGIKCLCNLQVSADTDGSIEASASGAGDCGLGDPAPTLSIDCDAVLSGKAEGAFFYILEVERNGIFGDSSFVTFDKDGWEVTALNFPKGVSEKKDLTIYSGALAPIEAWRTSVFNLEKQNPSKLKLCKNDRTPGSWEYNLLEMSNQIILDGRGCPLEKGAKTSEVPKPPQALPPAIYQFPEMLPCDRMRWTVKMNGPNNRFALQVYYEFTPIGLCKPSPPKA